MSLAEEMSGEREEMEDDHTLASCRRHETWSESERSDERGGRLGRAFPEL